MQTIKKFWNSIPYWLRGGIIVLILYSIVFVSIWIYSTTISLLESPFHIYGLVIITASPVDFLLNSLFFYQISCYPNFIPCAILGFLEAFIIGMILWWLFWKFKSRK